MCVCIFLTMEDLYDPEEKITCPYNASHHIRRCRMSFHLVKCKKNYKDLKMVPCDFNATHLIPEPEAQYHHQTCPDRKKIEAQLVSSTPSTTTANERFPIPKIDVPVEESWDDLDCPTYNPRAYVENSDVLRSLNVAPESERKHFRMAERQRLADINREKRPPPGYSTHTESVKLPPHRPVTNISSSHSALREKLKMGANKVFVKSDNNNFN